MGKSIAKEIIITVLICAVLILLLAIVLYQYIPSNKVVPSKVSAYKTPENVEAEIEINNNTTEYTTTNQTFDVTDSDLSVYKQSKSYNPGKSDPFAAENTVEQNSTTNTIGTTTTNTNTTSNGSASTTDKNTTDNYYTSANVNKGTK